jgi:hypothetical protein
MTASRSTPVNKKRSSGDVTARELRDDIVDEGAVLDNASANEGREFL